MDIAQIERALRAGPPGEPLYVSGSFRTPKGRISASGLSVALFGAIVLGIVIGSGVGERTIPNGGVGGPAVPEAAAELRGRWVSEEISRERWINALLQRGHDIDDIEAFLIHDPIEASTRYELTFTADRIAIIEYASGDPPDDIGGGPYALLDDGRLRYDDRDCYVTARFAIESDRLTFQPIETESCGADERVANDAIFNVSVFDRVVDP
jgi:hypothetical protein